MVTKAVNVNLATRDQVAELSETGLSYAEIGRTLGISPLLASWDRRITKKISGKGDN